MGVAVGPNVWVRYRSWCLGHDLAPSTTEKSGRYLRFFERQYGLELARLSRDDAISFLARGREVGVKPKTLNSWVRELNLWSRFRSLGWKMAYYRRRGVPFVQVPDERTVRSLRALTWPNPSTSARNHALIALLADQGPRRNEVVRLDLADVRATPEGRPVVSVRFGKGEKERLLYVDETTATAIREYVDRFRIASDPRALFTTPRGRISYAYLAKVVKDAGARVGAPWLSPHKLRHYVCDSLLDANVSVPSVAEVLGHARWETTELYRSRRLTKVRAEQEIRAVARVRFGSARR